MKHYNFEPKVRKGGLSKQISYHSWVSLQLGSEIQTGYFETKFGIIQLYKCNVNILKCNVLRQQKNFIFVEITLCIVMQFQKKMILGIWIVSLVLSTNLSYVYLQQKSSWNKF